jgi:hypothetical protein
MPPYDISYCTLLPKGIENLWVACTAAAMAVSAGADYRDVSIVELQDRLTAANVILDPASAIQGL